MITPAAHPVPAAPPAGIGPSLDGPDRRSMARLAGISYVALFVLALFANFAVRERLVDLADPTATVANLTQSQGLVRAAIAAFIVVFALDVVVAWALLHLFRPAGSALSALAAWFRIVYTVFLGVAVVFLYIVIQLVDGPDHIGVLDTAAVESGVMLSLEAFNATWLVGLVAFGAHLILLAIMILRSALAGRWLGYALALAGTAYIFDTMAYTLYPDYGANAAVFTAIVAVPAIMAEAGFTWWLLARAARPPAR